MALNNVCRLCLTKDNLKWVFSERNEDIKLNEVIYISTGIEIHRKDVISQNICDDCYVFIIKIFQFRSRCFKSDKSLKERCGKYLEESKITIPNTEVSILKREPKKYKAPSYTPIIHQSVKDLCRTYPQVKLPPLCLKSHVAPVVCMELDEVENYFKKRKLDIKKYVNDALKSNIKRKPAGSNHSSLVTILKDKFRSKILTRKKEDQLIIGNANNARTQRNEISILKSKGKSIPLTKKGLSKPTSPNRKIKSPVKKIQLEIENIREHNSGQLSKELEVVPMPDHSTVNKNDSVVSLNFDKSVPLHLCNICNSVQYSLNYLKKHQITHTRCQFCKKRFRTVQQKDFHTRSQCIVKNAINKFPDVLLEKVEYDMKIRQKYPEAFSSFPPLNAYTDSTTTNSSIDECGKHLKTEIMERMKALISCPDILKSAVDNKVIEILSDEECSIPLHANNETLTCSEQCATDHDFPLMEPEINIRDNRLLDDIDPSSPDTDITKELLLKLNLLDPVKHKCAQTHELMTNNISHVNGKAVLKGLKHQLYEYKVKVIPKYGPFKVSYENNFTSKETKKLCLWDDLTPIDVKVPDNLEKIESQPTHSGNNSIITLKSDNAVISSAGTCQSRTNVIQLGQQSNSSDMPTKRPVKHLIRVKSIYKLL